MNEEYADRTDDEICSDKIPENFDAYMELCSERTQKCLEAEEPMLTGQVIGKAIVKMLNDAQMSRTAAVGQSYDGASTMSSNSVGASACVKEKFSNAEYYHCSAHALNLVLVNASTLPAIRDMIAVVKKVSTFLSKSNKKLITLKEAMRISGCDFRRLKGLCETRWVERITALENFAIFYVIFL